VSTEGSESPLNPVVDEGAGDSRLGPGLPDLLTAFPELRTGGSDSPLNPVVDEGAGDCRLGPDFVLISSLSLVDIFAFLTLEVEVSLILSLCTDSPSCFRVFLIV